MANILTKTQSDQLRRKLQEERTRILRVLQAPEESPPRADQESEIEEAAQRATARTSALGVAERERALLAEVDRALAKFDDGRYGVSESTGDPIRFERLAAVPWARGDLDE